LTPKQWQAKTESPANSSFGLLSSKTDSFGADAPSFQDLETPVAYHASVMSAIIFRRDAYGFDNKGN
jgi:hypothetical protein